jgi:hypothetical protein
MPEHDGLSPSSVAIRFRGEGRITRLAVGSRFCGGRSPGSGAPGCLGRLERTRQFTCRFASMGGAPTRIKERNPAPWAAPLRTGIDRGSTLARKSHAASRHQISGPWQNRVLIGAIDEAKDCGIPRAENTLFVSPTVHLCRVSSWRGAVLLSGLHTLDPAANLGNYTSGP